MRSIFSLRPSSNWEIRSRRSCVAFSCLDTPSAHVHRIDRRHQYQLPDHRLVRGNFFINAYQVVLLAMATSRPAFIAFGLSRSALIAGLQR